MSRKTTDPENSLLGRLLNKKLDRRTFLRISEKLAGVGLISSIPFLSAARDVVPESTAPYISQSLKFRDYPFKLGVTSGRPLFDLDWVRFIKKAD